MNRSEILKFPEIPFEHTFSKFSNILKPNEIDDLIDNGKITIDCNMSDAYNSYGLRFEINDTFVIKFKNGNQKTIKVESMENTEFRNVKRVTFISEEN